jgi:hypothetical protein
MAEFATHRPAIQSYLERALLEFSLYELAVLRVAIERQRKEGLPVSESVPMLTEKARRIAELIVGELQAADSDSPAEVPELEALIWKQLPNP